MIRITLGEVRNVIRRALMEAQGALKMLDVIRMRLILTKEMKVEEVLTGIRIIKGCATVNQTAPVQRSPSGKRILDVVATFDPQDKELLDYIDAMAQIVKRMDAVETVVIMTVNDQPVLDATGKRKLVY